MRSLQSATRCRCVSGRKLSHSGNGGYGELGLGRMVGLRTGGWRTAQTASQLGQRPQAARREPERQGRRDWDYAGRPGMPGRQQLAPAVRPFNHQVGFTLVPLAPHHHDQPLRQRMVRRRDPHPFDVTRTKLLSLSAGVAVSTSAPRW